MYRVVGAIACSCCGGFQCQKTKFMTMVAHASNTDDLYKTILCALQEEEGFPDVFLEPQENADQQCGDADVIDMDSNDRLAAVYYKRLRSHAIPQPSLN